MAYLIERYGLRLTMEQLAETLGWSVGTLHNKLARGELGLPTYVDGKLRFADVRDVSDYLDRKRAEAQEAIGSAA